MDNHTEIQRRKNMQAVKSNNSRIEVRLRKALWAEGLRYQKNTSKVYGKPDICFLSAKVAVFCDGEFWHGYDWKNRKNDIRSRKDFWIPKIEKNIKRDFLVNETLTESGWTVIRFWGNQIKNNLPECVEIIKKAVIKDE